MLLTYKNFQRFSKFSSSSEDDALLVRAKRQKILRKTWISRLDLYLITSD